MYYKIYGVYINVTFHTHVKVVGFMRKKQDISYATFLPLVRRKPQNHFAWCGVGRLFQIIIDIRFAAILILRQTGKFSDVLDKEEIWPVN